MSLHPIFAGVLSDFAAAAPVAASLTTHYPQVGRRRPYRSMGDAMSYEAGFLAYSEDSIAPAERTPFSDGWWDAFSAQESRNTYANERRADSAEES